MKTEGDLNENPLKIWEDGEIVAFEWLNVLTGKITVFDINPKKTKYLKQLTGAYK